jgi:predicted nucleotidyltransferase
MRFGLTEHELELIQGVFRNFPEVERVKIYGSRAMGTQQPYSDIDLALWGLLDQKIIGQISRVLDELPLPYTFDVTYYQSTHHIGLLQHIDTHGVEFYRAR